MRPLNCALVQSEDSKRDLQEIRDGMIRGFQSNGWSEKEIDAAMDGVHIWKCVGKTGDTFIEWLRGMQHSDPCDVIAINPIQGFFGGDVAKQDEVSHFLRDGLDPIIKGGGRSASVRRRAHSAHAKNRERPEGRPRVTP